MCMDIFTGSNLVSIAIEAMIQSGADEVCVI